MFLTQLGISWCHTWRFLMTLHSRSPAILLALFQKLFAGIPGFMENKDDPIPGRVRFVREYPEKSLRIVVTTPIKKFQSGLSTPVSLELVRGMRISFTIQHYNKKNHLDLRDSKVAHIDDKWASITERKATTLIELADGLNKCTSSKCTDLFYFPFWEAAPQGKPELTRFVWCKCLKCRRRDDTAFGTGLRTSLSQYIPKRK